MFLIILILMIGVVASYIQGSIGPLLIALVIAIAIAILRKGGASSYGSSGSSASSSDGDFVESLVESVTTDSDGDD